MNTKSPPFVSQQRNLIACHHCGYINDYISIKPGDESDCGRCGHQLYSERKNWETRTIALSVAGIILFICSNCFSFLGLEAGYQFQESTLLSGVYALYAREQYLLSLLVFLTIFLFPLTELFALSYVFIGRLLNRRPPGLSVFLHFLFRARQWNMLEIFLCGVLVTSVKLGETATLLPGFGLLSFALLVAILIVINLHISRIHLWNWYQRDNFFFLPKDRSFYNCTACNAIVGQLLWQQQRHCPRCEYTIAPRIENSVQKTTALLIASVILYIPAMILPIMSVTTLGKASQDTIMSGVVHLFHEGMWVIGLIVFIASILVPVTKLVIMGYLVWSVHNQHTQHQRARQRLYHITEFVGRWSMIDVFVITLLVALVQFGVLMNIQPEAAALAFASVVILTMLAAETFDPRLIWDKPTNRTPAL